MFASHPAYIFGIVVEVEHISNPRSNFFPDSHLRWEGVSAFTYVGQWKERERENGDKTGLTTPMGLLCVVDPQKEWNAENLYTQ
jgi:hypothetical protein